MSTTVLTDAELDRLWREFLVTATLWPHNAAIVPTDFARAVERAVLEKLFLAGGLEKHGLSPSEMLVGGCVAESEARERERKAWDTCADWNRYTYPADGASSSWTARERDRLYPSLQPKEVTGPSGTKYRKLDDGTVQEWRKCDEWCGVNIVFFRDVPTVAKLMAEP